MGKMRFQTVTAHRTIPTSSGIDVEVDPGYLRRLKIKNQEISAEELAEYAFDLELATRILVARHHNTSVETLEKLAMDDSTRVRIAVSQNPKSTARILDKQMSNFGDDVYLCRNASVHPNTSAGTLSMLSHHEDVIVLFNVAKHPNTMNETLGRLLECKFESVRNVARQRQQAILKQATAKQSSAGNHKQSAPVRPMYIPTNRSRCF